MTYLASADCSNCGSCCRPWIPVRTAAVREADSSRRLAGRLAGRRSPRSTIGRVMNTSEPPLVPRPATVTVGSGQMQVDARTAVHIGGDECPQQSWRVCPHCQRRCAAEGLGDEDELQSWFIRRIDTWLAARGRRLLGWDEILEGGLAPGATVMSWRGIDGGVAAAAGGHDVVMSPNNDCYLDYYQSADTSAEPPAIGGCLPLQQVYEFEPVVPTIDAVNAARVLGVQGNVWTEYIETAEQVEYMAFPRALALAEVGWTAPPRRSAAGFLDRLRGHRPLLDRLGVHYRPWEAG